MKTILEAIDGLGPLLPKHLRARVPPEILRTIEVAPPSAWLPLDHNVELTRVIAQVLGKARTHTFFRGMVLREYESSMFKSFIATFARLLGLTPTTYVKMIPKGWALVFRDCGRLTPFQRGPDEARLLYERIPPACVQDDVWLESVRSSFYSAFDLCEVDGVIDWVEQDLQQARAVLHFRWKPRAPARPASTR